MQRNASIGDMDAWCPNYLEAGGIRLSSWKGGWLTARWPSRGAVPREGKPLARLARLGEPGPWWDLLKSVEGCGRPASTYHFKKLKVYVALTQYCRQRGRRNTGRKERTNIKQISIKARTLFKSVGRFGKAPRAAKVSSINTIVMKQYIVLQNDAEVSNIVTTLMK